MNEKKLEHLLRPKDENTEFDDTRINEKIQKKIKKGIRKQIYTRVVVVLAIAALLVAGGAFGLSALLNLMNYDPGRITPAIQEDGGYYDFHILMETFLGLYDSDLVYVPVEETCTANGFGSYDVGAKIQSFFDPLDVDGYNNVTFHVDRSALDIESKESHVLAIRANEFLDPDDPGYFDYSTASVSQELTDEIGELPDSCILDVSISFGERRSLEDTIAFMDRYGSSDFHWIAVGMNGSTPDGIALVHSAGYELTEETMENYPDLFLGGDFTAQDLEQAYLSRLKLLLDHKNFMALLSSVYDTSMRIPHIQEQYKKVQENGLTAIGVRASVKKEDLLHMIGQDEIPYVTINDVKLSRWQR